METIKTQINSQLKKGNTKKALDILDDLLLTEKSSLHKELVILKGENELTDRIVIKNTIPFEKIQQRRNQTNDKILTLLECFENGEPSPFQDKKSSNNNSHLSLMIALFIALIVVLGLLVSNNTQNDDPSIVDEEKSTILNQDEKVEKVLAELHAVYPKYHEVYLLGNFRKKSEVRKKTKAIINQLEIIKDSDLELPSNIYKYIGLLISNKILSLTSPDSLSQIKYSEKALGYSIIAEEYIAKIGELEDEDYKFQLISWLGSERHEIRILVNKFLCSAVNNLAGGPIKEEEIKFYFNKLTEDSILQEETYDKYPIIESLEKRNIITL